MSLITPFRFSVSSDLHNQDDSGQYFRHALTVMTEDYSGGPGDFHVSTGDLANAGDCDASTYRGLIDGSLGNDFRWVPLVGNHDITEDAGASYDWIKQEFVDANGSGNREAISDYATSGPAGSQNTQYYFIHKGIMFVVLNPYWTGGTETDAEKNGLWIWGASGVIHNNTLEWLTDIFSQYPQYPKIVFCHPNAFALTSRHKANNLAEDGLSQRNQMWHLFDRSNVVAYIHGHTHQNNFGFVDNSFDNRVNLPGDVWSYGPKKTAAINPGCIHSYWTPYGQAGDRYPRIMMADITEASITFSWWVSPTDGTAPVAYNPWSLDKTRTINIPILDEYGSYYRGGHWFYTQRKPGTTWFDGVSNKKGWSVDFNLRISDVQNSHTTLDEEGKANGVGVYVNDGTRQETINFFPQEVVFKNADMATTLDTTGEYSYRVTGKENQLALYAKPSSSTVYSEVASVPFTTKATNNGNSLEPSVFEDANGDIHAAWWDDGDGVGAIYYSKYSNSSWSAAELVVEEEYGTQSPSLIANSDGEIYIVYEAKQTQGSVVSMVYRNNIGWSDALYTGVNVGKCHSPQLVFDSQSNVCVVWEDDRYTHPEIFLSIFNVTSLEWGTEKQLSSSTYGCFRPSITSYLDDLFVSWTQKEVGNLSTPQDTTFDIYVSKINALSFIQTTPSSVSPTSMRADHSSILANVTGRVFVAWHDDVSGEYKIYATILNPVLEVLTGVTTVVSGNGGARFPVLSEQTNTGDIYIAWQDFKEGYAKFTNPSDLEDPYYSSPLHQREPLNSSVFVAVYKDGAFLSSGEGSFDIELTFKDERDAVLPSLPPFFTGELPILYQSNLQSVSLYTNETKFISQARCAFYDLSRGTGVFEVDYGSQGTTDRDFLLSPVSSSKEIRFGDFSNVFNVHQIFKNFKIYTEDAVIPYSVTDIDSSNFNVDTLNAFDAVVNNYGDVWIIGTCGTFYFVNRQNRVALVGPEEEIPGLISPADDAAEVTSLKKFKAIAFDAHHNMYVGGDEGIRYSFDPTEGFYTLGSSPTSVKAITFDQDNTMFVGTATGLRMFTVTESGGAISISDMAPSGAPTSFVTSLAVDSNNCVWIGTRSGLYRYYKGKFINFTTDHGLSSNRINDIAIRNTAIRYLATPNGINKMVGFSVEKNIQSDDSIWNNNVKSVLWKEPNIILAGTMDRLNQITVNETTDSYSTLIYQPSAISSTETNDLQTYYILLDSTLNSIDDSDIIEVYINGNPVPHGYELGWDKTTDEDNPPRIIRFLTPLNNDDIVEVVVRGDLRLIGSFFQSEAEKATIGDNLIRIKDFAAEEISNTETKLYVVTEGDENEVKVNDSDSLLPYDKAHLDTTPPSFTDGAEGIQIGSLVGKNTVRITISGATDQSATDAGSGIDRMVISNRSDFTTDGTTAIASVPYNTRTTHYLGATLDDIATSLAFSSGSGTVVQYFSDVQKLYAATSLPAVVYEYDGDTGTWDDLITFDSDQYIDFIEKFNESLFIGVGHASSSGKVYVYSYTYDTDGAISGVSLTATLPIAESRVHCAHELDGKFYIGAGIGPSDEYVSGAGSGGAIYSYDDGLAQGVDPDFTEVVSGIDDNVYSLTHVEGNSNLLAATGSNGYVYEVDVDNNAAYIIHNDPEAILSMVSNTYDDNKYIFTGGATQGLIRRSLSENMSFDTSFRTVPSAINVMKVFTVSEGDSSAPLVFASVGSVLYYLSSTGSWLWKYSHSEEIEDITYDPATEIFYVVSSSYVTQINPSTQEKLVYLKLIDRAGNATTLTSFVADNNPFIDSITLENLIDFVNENKLLELDELGNITPILEGNSKYYSGDKIEQEKGEYVSEVFDGSNDLVKWESIAWEVTELHDTEVLLYIRTSSSSNDILTTEWVGPYASDQSSGVDLSAFAGQYIQFKAELISEYAGRTPSFHNATIRAITTEAIHFFTTNFALSSRINKGIITSQKIVPVAADVVFGINTTNSIDWTEYQEVDENRVFNVNQVGENLRIGIKLISPSRSVVEPTVFDEYGPYNTNLYVNTVDLDFTNNTGSTHNYHFRVTLYSDVGLTNEVYSAYSSDSSDGFNVDGEAIPSSGVSINDGETVNLLFSVPGSANITCNTYYYVKVEYIYGASFVVISNTYSFVSSCTSTFIDTIDFNFSNDDVASNYYHFRIKFYEDPERINEYKTVFSGNDRSGWFVDDVQIPEAGALIASGDTVNVVYRPTATDFSTNVIYYLTIEAHDGTEYVFASNSYTFQTRDVVSSEACGGYMDVPIVKNFGIMLELDDNEFVTLNI